MVFRQDIDPPSHAVAKCLSALVFDEFFPDFQVELAKHKAPGVVAGASFVPDDVSLLYKGVAEYYNPCCSLEFGGVQGDRQAFAD